MPVFRGFQELAVDLAAITLLADLPLHHRDPFDRLIVAQAMTHTAQLMTSDAILARYTDLVVMIG